MYRSSWKSIGSGNNNCLNTFRGHRIAFNSCFEKFERRGLWHCKRQALRTFIVYVFFLIKYVLTLTFFLFNNFIWQYRTSTGSWHISLVRVVRINILWWLGCRFDLKCTSIKGERYILKRLVSQIRRSLVKKIGLRVFRRCTSMFVYPVCDEPATSLIYSCLFVGKEKKNVFGRGCLRGNISFKSFPKTAADAGCVHTPPTARAPFDYYKQFSIIQAVIEERDSYRGQNIKR